jgi:hypothetical protein
MTRNASLFIAIVASFGLFACSIDDGRTAIKDRGQGLVTSGSGSGSGSSAPDAGPTPSDAGPTPSDAGPTPSDAGPTPSDAGLPPPPPSCTGQSTTTSPEPGVNAIICMTSSGPDDGILGTYSVTASFQIDGSYFGSPGMITGTLGMDANLSTDDAGTSSFTVLDETSGQWTRDGIAMSASEFALLWSQVAPGQAVPSPGGSMIINSTVVIQAMAAALNLAAAADPCQADANNLDAAATTYNITVGGSILGAAAIGLLEIPSWGTATAGFVGLSSAVITAKVNYNNACKNFQLCCKNNNWPAGVCRPKGAKRRGCKNK